MGYSFMPWWSHLPMLLPIALQCWLLVGESAPKNRTTRILLALLAAPMCLATPFVCDLIRPRERAIALNFAGGIAGPYGAFRALEFGFAKDRYVWKGLDGEGDGKPPTGWQRVQYALYLLTSMRMIGWSPGPRTDQMGPSPPPTTGPFLKDVMSQIVFCHLLATVSAIPILEARTAIGGMSEVLTRYLPPFPLQDQVAAVLEALLLGQACWAALEEGQAIVTLISWMGLGLIRLITPPSLRPAPFDPRAYPPLWPSSPWLATSMARFWSKHWHALFLQPFKAVGFYPLRSIFRFTGNSVSTAAGVLGVFAMSALMHEAGLYTATRDLPGHDASQESVGRTFVFFFGTGVAVVLERAFTLATGRRVGGAAGKIWTFSLLLLFGLPMAQEWFQRGLVDHLAPVRRWRWQRYVLPLGWILPDDVLVD